MPYHIHCLVAFSNTQSKSINTMVGNGKRFMAYREKLKAKGENELLAQLTQFVNDMEKSDQFWGNNGSPS